MKLILYGRLGDPLGREVELPNCAALTVGDLRREIERRHPELAPAMTDGSSKAFIDDVIVPDGSYLGSVDRIEFFPPVSGG